ncbi:hypothetical protein [Roseomonas sp. BN140053]|uniref:hypothetical protein n=1 Tax=Roseomonas sp. BN140053 TaxID=3391898 RepID=UPI0039E767EE
MPEMVLLLFAGLQLWPFLRAFHQSADENFFQFLILSALDRPQDLLVQIGRVAEQQGRIGIFLAMPLELLGAMLPEYGWGRLLVVGCFGLLLLAFCRLLAQLFGAPLAQAALLLCCCTTPLAAHHLAPNAYPLLILLPLLGLVAVHLWLAGAAASHRGRVAAGLLLVVLTLVLEYAFVAGLSLAALAVCTARRDRRGRELRLHGSALAASAAIYLGYRAAFPSGYAGNTAGVPALLDVPELQWLHAVNGTVFPRLLPGPATAADLVLAMAAFAAATWLAWRLLPALARQLRPRAAGGVVLFCLGWAWLNTLPHALTAKYQAWCRIGGDCTYVDSRIAALGVGAALAVGLALLLRALQRCGLHSRVPALFCAGAVGLLGAATCLHNRAAARDMAGRELAFAVIRDATCRADGGLARDPAALRVLGRTILWHQPPMEMPPVESFLALYRDTLPRLRLDCRPIPFAPAAATGFLGWALPEAAGRWSLGSGAMLVLGGEAATAGSVLRVAAYVPPGGAPQRVTLRKGDGVVCSFFLDEVPRDLVLPGDADPAGRRALSLETPDAISPSAAGHSADLRELGVFLSSLRALQPGEAVPGGLDLRRCTG